MFNFFRYRKYKKMIKASSLLILEDFAIIVNDTIAELEKEGRIKTPLHKEVLKFESTALIFWFFRLQDLFPEPFQKLILDEVHQQYFDTLKRNGYNREQAQAMCDKLNDRYRTYDACMNNADDFVKIGTNFAQFVSNDAQTGIDAMEITIPVSLMEQARIKFAEYKDVMKV